MKNKLCAVLLAMTATGMLAGTASAATLAEDFTFTKYLVMSTDANVPNAQASFTVSVPEKKADAADGLGYAVVGDKDTPSVYVGIGAESLSVSIEAFKPGDTTSTTASGTVTLKEGEKYASKKATVTGLSKVNYTTPGIYRYVITENAPEEKGVSIDKLSDKTADAVRYMDVYVQMNGENLEASCVVFHRADEVVDLTADHIVTKPDGFANVYTTHTIKLEKQVTGNMGDRKKYFEFTVAFDKESAGTVYDVDLSHCNTQKNTTKTITIAEDGSASATFYLKDDDYVTIKGLTEGTDYTVTEVVDTKEGYTTTYDITGGNTCAEAEGLSTGVQTLKTADDAVLYKNNKDVTIPTGFTVEVLAFAGIAAAAGAGLVVTGKKRKKKEQ